MGFNSGFKGLNKTLHLNLTGCALLATFWRKIQLWVVNGKVMNIHVS